MLHRRFVAALAVALAGGSGCSGTLPPPTLHAASVHERRTEQANLLLFPVADGEALLGRAVQTTADGAWTIADALAPGCEVAVRRERAGFRAKRVVDLNSVTTLSAGYATLVGFEAKFGRANQAEIDIANTEVLRADTRGPCGDVVVDTVFVGHGKRSLLASAERGAHAAATLPPAAAAGASTASSKLVDTVEWDTEQAYGFAFRKNAKTEQALEVRVGAPSRVKDGQAVELTMQVSKPAYLVVYFLDASGRGDVLWPSEEEPAPHAEPGRPAKLPSDAESRAGIVLRAELRNKGAPERETLVIYGFAEKGDFDRLRPPSGSSRDDGAAYAAELTKKLAGVPMARWSRVTTSYVIEP